MSKLLRFFIGINILLYTNSLICMKFQCDDKNSKVERLTKQSDKLRGQLRDKKKIKELVNNERRNGIFWVVSAATLLSYSMIDSNFFKNFSSDSFSTFKKIFIASSILSGIYMFKRGITKIFIDENDIRYRIHEKITMNEKLMNEIIPIPRRLRGATTFFFAVPVIGK